MMTAETKQVWIDEIAKDLEALTLRHAQEIFEYASDVSGVLIQHGATQDEALAMLYAAKAKAKIPTRIP